MGIRSVGIGCCAWICAACAMGPDFHRPAPATPDYSAAKLSADIQPPPKGSELTREPLEARWWDGFADPELSSLIARAAAANLDVKLAVARVAESRAQLGISQADLYPQVNGNASYTRQQLSNKGAVSLFTAPGGNPATQTNGMGGAQGGAIPSSAAGGSIPPFNLFQYGFDATWELDLWGHVRRQAEGAGAQLEAAVYDQRDALVTAVAEVARDYFQLRGTQETLRITRDDLNSFQRSADITEEQRRAGLATELDVANAQAQASSTAAGLPQLEQQESEQIDAIGVLLGEYPGSLRGELAPPAALPPPPQRVPVGLPSELVQRRPDIRAAEANLHAATAGIGAAKADFFPKITLSGSFAFQAIQFKDLGSWDARSWSFGPGLTVPIFDGHRLRATLHLREAQQQEAAIQYQKAVLTAFQEVDGAMTAFNAEQSRRSELERAAAAAKRAMQLAGDRYQHGLTDYLQVLIAQRTLLQSQRQLVESQTTVSTNLVALYKALGGGWEAVEPDIQAGR